MQWTKRALNQWLRSASPAFGESLALEMLGLPRARRQRGGGRHPRPPAPRFPVGRPARTETSGRPAEPGDQATVTRVPIGVSGKTTAALAGGISTHPSLWGKP